MKEISIEEKASRYDEAIKRGKQIQSTPYTAHWDIMKEVVEHVLPELKESEDEKIRKEMIDFLQETIDNVGESPNIWSMANAKKWISFLENKGEQKLDGTFINVDDVREGFMARVYSILSSDPTNDRANQILDAFDCLPTLGLEPQGAHSHAELDPTRNAEPKDYNSIDPQFSKNISKVEPKFNEGEWVAINPELRFASPILINDIHNNNYRVKSVDDNIGEPTIDYIDRNYHRWSIQDAKDGDVLVTKNKNIFIFKTINGNTVWDYCGLYFGKFCVSSSTVNGSCAPYLPRDYAPATKEQRDLLFQQMREEGYEWDSEKKELKQIEQKPNPYSGTSFEYNGHTWGMCARDNGVEILMDGHVKGRVFTNDSNAKEMFIKALERVEEQNSNGYKLTDCDKNSWWEDFKAYTSCATKQNHACSEEDEKLIEEASEYLRKYANQVKGGNSKVYVQSIVDRIETLKDRVQPQQEWSEEDEEMVEGLDNCLDELEKVNGWNYVYVVGKSVELNNVRKWVKSLKERIGGKL